MPDTYPLENILDAGTLVHDKLDSEDVTQGTGSISGISLPSVLELLSREGKTCLFEVVIPEGNSGLIYFYQGMIWNAVYEKQQGEDALFSMLSQKDIRINFLKLPKKKVKRGIFGNAMSLLLKWSIKKDETDAAKNRESEKEQEHIEFPEEETSPVKLSEEWKIPTSQATIDAEDEEKTDSLEFSENAFPTEFLEAEEASASSVESDLENKESFQTLNFSEETSPAESSTPEETPTFFGESSITNNNYTNSIEFSQETFSTEFSETMESPTSLEDNNEKDQGEEEGIGEDEGITPVEFSEAQVEPAYHGKDEAEAPPLSGATANNLEIHEANNAAQEIIAANNASIEQYEPKISSEQAGETSSSQLSGDKLMGQFDDILGKLRDIEGFSAVGIFSPEGEMVSDINNSGLNIEEIGALANDVLLKAQKATELMGIGRGQTVHIEAPQAHVIARCLDESTDFAVNTQGRAHIHIVLLLSREGNLAMGKIRLASIALELAPLFH